MRRLRLLTTCLTATWTLALPALSPAAEPPAPAGANAPAAAADPAARARRMAERGLEYLKSQQKPDGGWQGPRDPPGITALVLRSFAADPKHGPKAEYVKKGYDHLLSYQVPEGGIYKDMMANYNTAIAVSALAEAKDPAYKERIDRAVAFLKGLQVKVGTPTKEGPVDEKNNWLGGAGYQGASRPDLSNTQMLVEALHDAGLKPDDPAYQNALKFIQRSQNRSESNDQPWAGDDGGFVYTPVNGGSSNAGEYVDPSGARRLRSYGLMTYAGLKSMIYAGLTKDDPRVKAAWGWISSNWTVDEHPGMRAAGADKAQAGMYYYYYTLARALDVYDEPTITDAKGRKHDWRLELIAKLETLQQPDGSWVGEKSWMENNPVLATSYVVMALQDAERDLKEHPPGK